MESTAASRDHQKVTYDTLRRPEEMQRHFQDERDVEHE